MTTTNARAEVLRAAGHRDAADLLESLDRIEQPAAPTTTEVPTQPTQAPTPEQAARQEGEALLSALYKGVPSLRPGAQDER